MVFFICFFRRLNEIYSVSACLLFQQLSASQPIFGCSSLTFFGRFRQCLGLYEFAQTQQAESRMETARKTQPCDPGTACGTRITPCFNESPVSWKTCVLVRLEQVKQTTIARVPGTRLSQKDRIHGRILPCLLLLRRYS